MNVEAFRQLQVLEALSAGSPAPTQRHLSKTLGVALGLTNLMIRRCVKKGYVKVVGLRSNRLRYLVTPKGVVEKTRLTYEYLEYSLHLYRRVRQTLQETLRAVKEAGGRRVALLGTDEVAEVAYLTVQELGLELAAVVDDEPAAPVFLGRPVEKLDTLRATAFDCGIVTTLREGEGAAEGLLRRLEALGISTEAIVFIQRQGPQIRAVLPPATGIMNAQEVHS